MWNDEFESIENGRQDYNVSYSRLDSVMDESEQQESSNNISIDNIDEDQIFIPRYDVIQNNPENENEGKIVEAILISSNEEDKDKNSTKEDDKKGRFQSLKKKEEK
jgi:hypothetical protein